jgi:hypothetical protein
MAGRIGTNINRRALVPLITLRVDGRLAVEVQDDG